MKNQLTSIALFTDLNSAEKKLLANFLLEKKYKKNDKIFSKGKTEDKLVIIQNGQIALDAHLDGLVETIVLLQDNDSLAEDCLLAKKSVSQYDARVVSDQATVWELSIYNWRTIVKKQPAIAHKIYQNIALIIEHRFDEANSKLVSLFAVSKILNQQSDLPQMANHIMEIILQLIPSKYALFASYNSANNKIQIYYKLGFNNFKTDYYSLDNDDLLNSLLGKPRPYIITKKDEPLNYAKLPYHSSNSLLIVPCHVKNQVFAFIILGDKKNGRNFTGNNQILIQTISQEIAPAIEKIMLEQTQQAAQEIRRHYIEPFGKF